MLAELRSDAPTLASLLSPYAVSPALLEAEYGDGRTLVRFMLGTVPHADPYLAIWAPAMRAQGLLVPTMLNLPGSLFGLGIPLSLAGLSMFAASKSAECSYCTAHSCTFAIRRGLSIEAIVEALGQEGTTLGLTEMLTLELATKMAGKSTHVQPETVLALEETVGRAKAEWLALAAGMMGYLNTMMDALGVELEKSIEADVSPLLRNSNWSSPPVLPDESAARPMVADSWWDRLSLARTLPGALLQSLGWTRGVPSSKRGVLRFLEQTTGHGFSLLGEVGPASVRQALAMVLRDHLEGPPRERLIRGQVAVVLGTALESHTLSEVGAVIAGDQMGGVQALAAVHPASRDGDVQLRFALATTQSAGPVDPDLLRELAIVTSPEEVISLVSWLGVLRLLHRLERFYAARRSARRLQPYMSER